MKTAAPDDDAYRLTACYAAGRCQGDLGCPRPPGRHCLLRPDDDYDDALEPWP